MLLTAAHVMSTEKIVETDTVPVSSLQVNLS